MDNEGGGKAFVVWDGDHGRYDRLKHREWSYLVGRWQDKRDGT